MIESEGSALLLLTISNGSRPSSGEEVLPLLPLLPPKLDGMVPDWEAIIIIRVMRWYLQKREEKEE